MNRGLTFRILLSFVLLSAVLLTTVGVLSYRSGSRSLKGAAISEMLANAIEKEAALDGWFAERLADIQEISSHADVVEKASKLATAAPASQEERSARAILLEELDPYVNSFSSNFTELFVIGAESGKVLVSTRPGEEGKLKRGHLYFDNGKTNLYLQPAYFSADVGAPTMTAAIPMRASDGRVVAVLAARLNLGVVNTITQRRTGLRQTEDSYLFNAEEYPITQPRFIDEPVVLRRKMGTEAVRLGVAGKNGVILTADYRGVPSIAVYRWNARHQLGLVVKIDQAEALAPARAFGWSVILISSLALLAAGAVAFLVARTITNPLHALHDRVSRFAEGNIKGSSRGRSGDEVMLLAREFDGMAARVTGRTAELATANEALRLENAERQRAEEALRTSEEKFRQLAENITDVFWMTSPDWSQTHYVSPAYRRIWGRSEENLYTHPHEWSDAIFPEDREAMFAIFNKLATGGPGVSAEFRITRPDGAVRWIHTKGFPILDGAGKVIRLTGIASDITERKVAEEARDRLVAILESTTDMVSMADPDGRLLYLNHAGRLLLGVESHEVITAMAVSEFLPNPGSHPGLTEGIPTAIRQGSWSGDTILINRKGQEIPVSQVILAHKTSDGKLAYFSTIVRDLSEREKLENLLSIQTTARLALAESSNLEPAVRGILQLVCETLGWDIGQFWSVDRRAQVLRCAEIWGGPRPEIAEFIKESRPLTIARGSGLAGRIWETARPAWIDDVVIDSNFPGAPFARKAGLHGAFAFPIFSGREVIHVIQFFSRESRKPDEALLKIFDNIASQISQFIARNRLEGQLIQSQKMETVGKLAGGIAYEFNSIMTAIIGQSELLLHDLPPGSPLRKNAIEIHEAADRAAALTRQLLAYGRKQILQPAILDLNVVLKGMEGALRHLAGREIDLQIAPSSGSKEVKADPGQIEQVIMNIVINAVDAMPNGGKLTLETASVILDAEYSGRVPDLKPGEYVMLAITDTGAGMNDAVKSRLFEPFFTTKDIGQGTGLGLATCQGIIKQSEGHISVYSEPSRGATFKIYLPKARAEKKFNGPPIKSSDLPRGTETVLLVEDDPALREMAGTLLGRLGYTVLTAANGVQALDVTHRPGIGHIDLLFTDVVMPHMSGKELSDRIRATHAETRILFTSAYAENAIVHQGVLNPGVALLQKPFTPSALARKVRAILDAPIADAAPISADQSPFS